MQFDEAVKKQILLTEEDRGNFSPKIDLFTAVMWCLRSWHEVTKETIVNCFKKSKFNTDGEMSDNVDEDINEEIKEMQVMMSKIKIRERQLTI